MATFGLHMGGHKGFVGEILGLGMRSCGMKVCQKFLDVFPQAAESNTSVRVSVGGGSGCRDFRWFRV